MFKFVENDEFKDFGKDNAQVLQYKDEDVYFLISKRGGAIEIHVSAKGRKGKLKLREASKAVVDFIPKAYPWCKMLIAPVAIKSVYNLCIRVGFKDLGEAQFEKGKARLMVIDYEFCR